jgi:hypothetical protein
MRRTDSNNQRRIDSGLLAVYLIPKSHDQNSELNWSYSLGICRAKFVAERRKICPELTPFLGFMVMPLCPRTIFT